MALRPTKPCLCGRIPKLAHREQAGVYMLGVECECSKPAAVLMYIKPTDRECMEQAAWDGWNLAD